MRFSVWLSSGNTWPEIKAAAIDADAAGWDGIWIPDHFMPPEEGYESQPESAADPELGPVHEAWSLVAAIAAVTERARIGVLVSGNTYRHPAVVAKMATTIDHISGGRAVLGLGAGWQENEHRRYGIRYGTPAERSDWLEEAAAMITSLVRDPRTDHAGDRYRLEGAPLEPKPIQQPLPLLIGGGGERRTLRTAARFADEWNIWGTPEDLVAKGAILDQHLDARGRPRHEVARSAAAMLEFTDTPDLGAERRQALGSRGGLVGTVDEVAAAIARYEAAGCREVVIPDYNHDRDSWRASLARLRTEVLAPPVG